MSPDFRVLLASTTALEATLVHAGSSGTFIWECPEWQPTQRLVCPARPKFMPPTWKTWPSRPWAMLPSARLSTSKRGNPRRQLGLDPSAGRDVQATDQDRLRLAADRPLRVHEELYPEVLSDGRRPDDRHIHRRIE